MTHALLDVVRQRLFAVRYRSELGLYSTAGGVLTSQRCRAARLRRLAGDRWLVVAGLVSDLCAARFGDRRAALGALDRHLGASLDVNLAAEPT